MNKTAVQQIVDRLGERAKESRSDQTRSTIIEDIHFYSGQSEAFKQAASIAAEFLEVEKKQIKEAFNYSTWGKVVNGEDYYQQTFKQ